MTITKIILLSPLALIVLYLSIAFLFKLGGLEDYLEYARVFVWLAIVLWLAIIALII